MKSLLKPLLVSAIVATAGWSAFAQGAGDPLPKGPRHMHRSTMDPAKMQEMVAKRQAELKAQLQLSAIQDGAWASYVAAMQPSVDMAARMRPENRERMRAEIEKLTTPERIDRVNALRARRDAEITRRGEATKSFYAVLSAEQQKVFDASTLRRGRHDGFGNPAQNG